MTGRPRVTVLGGTRFIGRAVVRELLHTGHEVQMIHRGEGSCALFPEVAHLHADRADLPRLVMPVRSFRPDVVVDINGLGRTDVTSALPAVRDAARFVVISSCDVYDAYLGYRLNKLVQSGPITERSPLRKRRRVLPHAVPQRPDYDKLDVEDAWRGYPAVILRPTAVYGEYDYLRREGFVLDRILARRRQIPFGPGNLRYTRVSVTDLARCVRLVVDCEAVEGETFNVAEHVTLDVRAWAQAIARAADVDIEYVPVHESVLPDGLRLSTTYRQHLVISSTKARTMLGWLPSPLEESITASVRWHAGRAPVERSFAADDLALATVPPTARTS